MTELPDSHAAITPPVCQTCGGQLSLLSSGRLGGVRFYAEGFVYRCPAHGVVWHTREEIRGSEPNNAGEDMSPVLAPRRPSPPRDAAASVEELESESR